MYHAGASVKMTYSNVSSSANGLDTRSALVNYFDYDASMHSKFKMYYTDQEWNKLMMDELDQRRPIICNGTSDINAGHTFICDGYNSKGFHFNMGWGSGYLNNSYISFSSLQYRNGLSAIVGIQPNNNLNRFYEFYLFYMGTIIPGLQCSSQEVTIENGFTVDYPYRNTGSIDFIGKQGALLIQEKDDGEEIVAVLGFNNVNISTTGLNRYPIVNTSIECRVPSNVRSGDYWIQPAMQPDNSDEWIFVKSGFEAKSRLPLKVNNPSKPVVLNLLDKDKVWYSELGTEREKCYSFKGLLVSKTGEEKTIHNKVYYEVGTIDYSFSKDVVIDIAYLRQDGAKVYCYKEGYENEVLLYDFYLDEGDTFNIPLNPESIEEGMESIIVSKVENVTYNNKIRKHYTFNNGLVWIEGLGSNEGLFYYSSKIPEALIKIKACKVGNEMIYYNSNPDYCIQPSVIAFPESEAIWNVQQFHSYAGDTFATLLENRYGILGDTIINNQKYNKLYLLNDTLFNQDRDIFLGGFRQKEKQVWCYLNHVEKEFLIYDFSKQKGESITLYNSPSLICFDPHLENTGFQEDRETSNIYDIEENSYGKVFYFDEYKRNFWIEGIGNSSGLFTHFFTYPLNGISYHYNLACFKQGNEIIYLNNEHAICKKCFTPEEYLSTNEVPIESNRIVVWNKTASAMEIHSTGLVNEFSFELMNIQGQVILMKNIPGGLKLIPTGQLDKGVYIYKIRDMNNSVQTGKILVN